MNQRAQQDRLIGEEKTNSPIRVLSVEDSAVFRKVLTDVFDRRGDIELVGCATDPFDARDQLMTRPVDVMTLDLELPRMAGLTFLKLVMERKPMPVIVLSGQAPMGSQKAIEALIAGAFSIIEKPDSLAHQLQFGDRLINEVRQAAAAPLRRRRPFALNNYVPSPAPVRAPLFDPRKIIALGASTGGTQALEDVLKQLPDHLPGIVVVQHIPAGFSASFAARLNRSCLIEVREARNGDLVRPGLALIAPGDQHMEVEWIRDQYRVTLHAGEPVEHQRPSVDVLFRSLARCAGRHTVAVLLTGMGRDGASGMKELHDLRAQTLAQDAESSVVYGMARRAVELDAVDSVLPLEEIAPEIVRAVDKRRNPLTATTYVQR